MLPSVPPTDPGIPSPSSTTSFWHSQPSSYLHNHRTTPHVPTDTDIVIIGSGLSGTMASHYLYAQGGRPNIVMLEARQACWGATGRNGGHCRPNAYALTIVTELLSTLGVSQLGKLLAFQHLNFKLVSEYIDAERVDCDWRVKPAVDAFFSEESFKVARESIDAMKKTLPEFAERVKVITRDTAEGRRILAQEVRTPTAVGAVVSEGAGSLWPYKLCAYILEKAIKEDGMNLQTSTPVVSIANTGGGKRKWTVITARGNVQADKVIFATNAHTAHLLPSFRGHIYPVRGQMSALVPPRSMMEKPLTHTFRLLGKDRKMDQYLVQRPIAKDGSGGELMLGGGRSLAAGFGEGCFDTGIDEPVARFLRRGPSEFFAGETGYPGDAVVGGLEKSLVSRFRRLTIDAVISSQLRFWDAAEGIGLDEEDDEESDSGSEYDDDNSQSITQDSRGERECTAKYEWTGVMGFSSDERPWVGRVPALTEEEARSKGLEGRDAVVNTEGLWMLAGFEGHGMAYCTGSAKALVQMMGQSRSLKGQQSVYEYFPECLEASRERMGLPPSPEVDEEVDEEVDVDEEEVVEPEEDEGGEWVVV